MPESPRPINLEKKFAAIPDHWNPRIVAQLNGQHVRLARLLGDFVWHRHDEEDELFLVVRGRLQMGMRVAGEERWEEIAPGELIVIPRGLEHCPRAREEVHVLLFEPAGTLNTGNVSDERTRRSLETL